ncbi:MAG: serine/threonine protein kinase [Gammaproteobacteria bacterium]|nr:serine/threonine protein kinase [Gammaproteobacteria bacterium]
MLKTIFTIAPSNKHDLLNNAITHDYFKREELKPFESEKNIAVLLNITEQPIDIRLVSYCNDIARQMLLEGKYDIAIEIFNDTIRYANSIAARFDRADCLLKQGNEETSTAERTEALRLWENQRYTGEEIFEECCNHAKTLYDKNQYNLAEKLYSIISDLDNDIYYLMQFVICLLKQNKKDNIESLILDISSNLEQQSKSDDATIDACAKLGEELLQKNKFGLAQLLFNHAARLSNNDHIYDRVTAGIQECQQDKITYADIISHQPPSTLKIYKGQKVIFTKNNKTLWLKMPHSLIWIDQVGWCIEKPRTQNDKQLQLIRLLAPINPQTETVSPNVKTNYCLVKKTKALDSTFRIRNRFLKEVEKTKLIAQRKMLYQERTTRKKTVKSELTSNLIPGVNLWQLITNPKTKPNLNTALAIGMQMLKQLANIQIKKHSHGDVKLTNIMYNPITCELCFIDYEFSESNEKIKAHRGTVKYAAPEVFLEENHVTFSADNYSAGVSLSFLFGIYEPWVTRNNQLVTLKEHPFVITKWTDTNKSILNMSMPSEQCFIQQMQTNLNLEDLFVQEQQSELKTICEVISGLTKTDPKTRMDLAQATKKLNTAFTTLQQKENKQIAFEHASTLQKRLRAEDPTESKNTHRFFKRYKQSSNDPQAAAVAGTRICV